MAKIHTRLRTQIDDPMRIQGDVYEQNVMTHQQQCTPLERPRGEKMKREGGGWSCCRVEFIKLARFTTRLFIEVTRHQKVIEPGN